MDSTRVSAILMAAGTSRRMGQDKLLLPFAGQSLLARALSLLTSLPFHQALLVTTPERLAAVTVPPGVTPLLNPAPQLGQSGSLRLGVEAADGDCYLFLTADQPLLDRESLLWLLSHGDGQHIVYPTIGGQPCSPALFPVRFRQQLLAQQGDAGGRAVRLAHPEACFPVEAPQPHLFQDIDTPEDYQSLLSHS